MRFDQLKRRDLLTLLAGGAAGLPLPVPALPVDRVRRVGVLLNGSAGDSLAPSYIGAFQDALENLGWTVGRDFQIDYRWDAEAAAAEKILSLTPDVIVADDRPALEALRAAALTIPVVFMEIDQPVFYGFVESLGHPGVNMTGFTDLDPSVGAKWLELLKEIVPSLTRVAVIFNPRTAPGAALFSLSAEEVAPRLAVEVIRAPVYETAGIEAVVTMLAGEPGGGLIFPIDPFTTVRRDLVFDLAVRNRLPAIYGFRGAAAAGGLAYYGIDLVSLLRQAAENVDRILRGERAADLPVRKPTKFRFAHQYQVGQDARSRYTRECHCAVRTTRTDHKSRFGVLGRRPSRAATKHAKSRTPRIGACGTNCNCAGQVARRATRRLSLSGEIASGMRWGACANSPLSVRARLRRRARRLRPRPAYRHPDEPRRNCPARTGGHQGIPPQNDDLSRQEGGNLLVDYRLPADRLHR